jgi:hypothetical protein
MMPIYVLREGFSNTFNIHRMAECVDDAVEQLRGGDSQALHVFEVLQVDQDAACLFFLHRQLRNKRIVREGEGDFFELDPIEMLTIVRDVRSLFDGFEASREAVSGYASETSTNVLIEPTPEDQQLIRRILTNREERDFLAFECELLENQLKQRIGKSSGIRGLATWRTQMSRMYSEEIFRKADPELYQELLERYYCLDTKVWRKKQPEQYKEIQTTYFSPRTCRSFKLLPVD